MLNAAGTLKGYELHGRDGELGSVKDFYFDDEHWTVRYLVVDTGHWLAGRQVLISPYQVSVVDDDSRSIRVDLTKQQIEDSPSLDGDRPVSGQFEMAYHGYYRLPSYWGGTQRWGSSAGVARDLRRTDPTPPPAAQDGHLRSTNDVSGYHIRAAGQEMGRVDDFIIQGETWVLRYLVIDTRKWWPGRKVVVSPNWIARISWSESTVYFDLTRETIKRAPEYTELPALTRDYETALHRYYDLQGYWVFDER